MVWRNGDFEIVTNAESLSDEALLSGLEINVARIF
jgi:hypothetical protein